MATVIQPSPASVRGRPSLGRRRSAYIRFVVPAVIVIGAVIVFPWLFSIWMSLNEWQIGSGAARFIGLENFATLAANERFLSSIGRTLYYTALATILPLVLGLFAAVVFNQHFPLRGILRTAYTLPMMATPVAIALVWTMMFHPQIGVLNYLLGLVGLPKSLWVYAPDTVIPALVLVEVWQWTPLVMLIVLGGLASLPIDPYESAVIDGATSLDLFRFITFPLILPYLMVALILRGIDAIKAFDIIYVISSGGPGTASETINLYLYVQAFQFFQIGHSSAVVIVFFTLIVALTLVLVWARERLRWTQ